MSGTRKSWDPGAEVKALWARLGEQVDEQAQKDRKAFQAALELRRIMGIAGIRFPCGPLGITSRLSLAQLTYLSKIMGFETQHLDSTIRAKGFFDKFVIRGVFFPGQPFQLISHRKEEDGAVFCHFTRNDLNVYLG